MLIYAYKYIKVSKKEHRKSMIKGIDIGSHATKDENMHIFPSLVGKSNNILGGAKELVLNGEVFYLGEGDYDTKYRKVERENYIKLLYSMLCAGANNGEIQLVLGLPIAQFKEDKENLISLVKENFHMKGRCGKEIKEFVITDVEVFPEGIASINPGYNGIIVDIGGLTTDIALVVYDKRIKIEKAISIPSGTLKLYSNFINAINTKYCLDLQREDAERIIRNGLKIRGKMQDTSVGSHVFISYIDNLLNQLKVEFSLDTNNITFTGGGSKLLRKSIEKRLDYAEFVDDAIFSNAKGYYKVGVNRWQNN